MPKLPKLIDFLNTDKSVASEPQLSVLDLALKNDLNLDHSCDGMGTCGTCRVFIKSGLERLEAPGEIEQEMINDRSFKRSERLACQIKAVAGLKIWIPED